MDEPRDAGRRGLDSTTQDLLRRIGASEDQAWQTFFGLHRDLVRKELRRRFPRAQRPGIDTEDVVQESIGKVLQKIEDFEYRGPGSLQGWLLRIAINTYLSTLNSQSRSPEVPAPTGVYEGAESADPRPSQIVRNVETEERLGRAIRQLDDIDQEIIHLCDVLDLPRATIAAKLGVNDSTVRRRHREIILKLERMLRT